MAGSFTKGVSVYDLMPYESFSYLELLVVEHALRLVWAESSERYHCHKIDFSRANEDQISTALVLLFDNIWSKKRKWLKDLDKIFHPIPEFNSHHGAVNYLGKALTFRPDLTFRRKYTPPGMSALNGCLFIEAKVLDSKKTMSNYCGHGLIRFVNGTYAWAMPQAMMLGYCKQTSQQLPVTLANHLQQAKQSSQYHLKSGPDAYHMPSSQSNSYLTEHGRPWLYPGTFKAPGTIKILHLWLTVK